MLLTRQNNQQSHGTGDDNSSNKAKTIS
uniref:Uncharacterized protein n=1 Tax=Arundo donax TaxID=35708 RepID=A0A0A9AS09_ARUDO